MSRKVSVSINIDDPNILNDTLKQMNCEWSDREGGGGNQVSIDKIDGKSVSPYLYVDLEEGGIHYDEDYRRHRDFARNLRRDYQKNKALANILREGQELVDTWVSDGVEQHELLAGVQKNDVVIHATK